MRIHAAFRELAFPFGNGTLRDVASADALVAVRFEPVIRAGKGCATLDLLFRRGDAKVGIPLVVLDVAMLEARERDPLVWPRFAAGAVTDDFAIAQRVEAWVRELFERRAMNRETWKIFGDDSDAQAFAAARDGGFLGAAPLEEVVRRAAPYVFARRHARGRDVVIAARDAALGARLLGGLARRVQIESSDDAATAWYAPSVAVAERDVVIVDREHRDFARDAAVVIDLDGSAGLSIEAAPVVPVDLLFDFTGSVRQSSSPPFTVTLAAPKAPPEPLVPFEEPVGGSAGKILFALRRGAFRFGGADVDHANAIAQAMREEGFTVEVTDDPHQIATFGPDLIHAFGVADAAMAEVCRRTAAAMKVPFVIHPLFDGAAWGGYWGATVTPYCYRFMQDETTVGSMLQLLPAGRLAVNDIRAETPFHPTNSRWEQDVRSTVSGADVIYVTGNAEFDAVRQLGIEGDVVMVAPPVPPAGTAVAVDALVGREQYVLVHAPIESTQNQLQAVRAAQIADLPLVLAGPIADPDYAAIVRAFADDRTMLLGDCDAATIEGLYRGAAVFLDAAWVGCGLERAVRAVSRGAALAISNRLPGPDLELGEFMQAVNPADVDAMARGLGDARYRRAENAAEFETTRRQFVERWGVREVTRRVVAGYAKALERRKAPVLR